MSKVAERKNHKVNVPAVGNTHEVENILGAAQEEAGFEKLLKFKKGDFFIGEELVPLGTKYIAHVIGWTRCWIKFVDDEVVERKTYRVALGERPPERADLDDLKRTIGRKALTAIRLIRGVFSIFCRLRRFRTARL
jgi:hypothetical protein